ncbi:MAG: nodulation protein NfeD [Deltaproteobacteria bacterium]|nr:nodulation protein NfeD [Deltaproteobacteria bacterium]
MKKLLYVCLFIASFCHSEVLAEKDSLIGKVLVLTVDGGINPATNDYIKMGMDRASRGLAVAVVIQMDTPGGLLTSTREIVQSIMNSTVPVIVYVSPHGAHAGSAGVMITLAAHLAAMAPATNIGAAHPVSGTGQDIPGDMEKKVTNDTAAWVESIAKTRGRNVKWAIDAVRNSVSISADKALKEGVIEFMADSLEDLLNKSHGRQVTVAHSTFKLETEKAQIVFMDMNLKQKVINTLADPNIAYLLMAMGGLGIYFELTHPGLIFPGVIGGISLILGFISMQTLPIHYGGLLLLLLGLALLVAEVFVPSFGVLGIGGLVSMSLGAIFFVDPSHPGELAVSLKWIMPFILIMGSLILVVVLLLVKARRKKKTTGMEGLVGEQGEAAEDILPPSSGRVYVAGELWSAYSSEVIKKGEGIIVVEVKGISSIKVKKG